MTVINTRNTSSLSIARPLAALSLLLALQSASVANADQIKYPTPHDSFLVAEVSSVNELVYEVNSNPKISARYARVYNIPEKQIATYFKQNLQIVSLQHNFYTKDYYVRHDGNIYTKYKLLRKGEKVYALANGRPVLQWACGNPITSSVLPYVPSKVAKKIEKVKPAVMLAVNPPAPQVVTPIEKVSPYQATLVPDAVTAPSAFSQPTDFNIPVSSVGSLNPSLLPAIGSLLFALHPDGGSSGSGGSAPATAPEANSGEILLLGGSIAFLAMAFRRKNKAASSAG